MFLLYLLLIRLAFCLLEALYVYLPHYLCCIVCSSLIHLARSRISPTMWGADGDRVLSALADELGADWQRQHQVRDADGGWCCDLCNKEFWDPWALDGHIRSHGHRKKFVGCLNNQG